MPAPGSKPRRYLLGFLALGLALPVIETLLLSSATGVGVLEVQRSTPLLWIVDLAPLLMGALGWLVGRQLDANARSLAGLNRRLQERTAEVERAYGNLDALLTGMVDAMIVTDPGDAIVRTNRAAQELLGRAAEELDDIAFHDVVVGGAATLALLGGEGAPLRAELCGPGADTAVPVVLTASPIAGDDGEPSGTVYVARALAPQIEIERRLMSVLRCMPHFVVLTGPDGTIRTTNVVEDEKHPEAPGRKLWEFVSSDQRARVRSACRRCVELMRPIEFETVSFTGDGVERRFHSRVGPVVSNGEISGLVVVKREVTAEYASNQRHRRLASAVEQAGDSIVITDPLGSIVYVNPAFEAVSGYSADEAIGRNPSLLKSGRQSDEVYADLWRTISRGEVWAGRLENRAKDGHLFMEEVTITPITDDQGRVENFLAVKRDITEQLAMEAQLAHGQKMESVGQLAAGIAHEINTPTQYVSDNTAFLHKAFDKLLGAVDASAGLLDAARRGDVDDDTLKATRRAFRRAKLDFLRTEVPKAIEQSMEGLSRVAKIVSAMKDFSHPSAGTKEHVDLGRSIETTVTVARNEWKYAAEVHIDVADDMPMVPCLRDELNQVLLNMVVNAAHAISDATDGGVAGLGTIRIAVSVDRGDAVITVADTGAGMPPEIMRRIFDPFFTTKEVGKGTGQGLAIAHNVVVERHGGTIEVDSTPGVGTTFTIRLPLDDSAAAKAETEEGHRYASAVR